jgi:hypothetical protein
MVEVGDPGSALAAAHVGFVSGIVAEALDIGFLLAVCR